MKFIASPLLQLLREKESADNETTAQLQIYGEMVANVAGMLYGERSIKYI